MPSGLSFAPICEVVDKFLGVFWCHLCSEIENVCRHRELREDKVCRWEWASILDVVLIPPFPVPKVCVCINRRMLKIRIDVILVAWSTQNMNKTTPAARCANFTPQAVSAIFTGSLALPPFSVHQIYLDVLKAMGQLMVPDNVAPSQLHRLKVSESTNIRYNCRHI